jgi:hypothetical protein
MAAGKWGRRDAMNRIACWSVLAIALTFSCAANAQSTGRARPSPAVEAPAIPMPVQEDIHEIARALAEANAKPPATDEVQRQREDLQAQKKMARSADNMLYVVGFEIFVTIIGITLVGITLYHTKLAADAARDAVDEAKKATDVTWKVGQAQTRAYVGIEHADFSLRHPDELRADSFVYPVVKIKVTNSGNSPADTFRWNVKTLYTFQQGCTGIPYQAKEPHPEIWGVALASRATIEQNEPCQHSHLRDKEKAAIDTFLGLNVYFEIETIYTDVFEREFRRKSVFGGTIDSIPQPMQRLKLLPTELKAVADRFLLEN